MSAAIINGCGLATVLGPTFMDTAKAYAANDRAFARDRNVIGIDGLPVTLGAVFPLHDIPDVLERLEKLIDLAVTDLEAQLSDTPLPNAVLLLLPAWLREAYPDGELSEALAKRLDRAADQLGLNWADQASFADVAWAASRAVADGSYPDVLVIGADTFIQTDLLDTLATQDRILNKRQPNGVIPSEAAIAVRICAADVMQREIPSGQMLGVWSGKEPLDIHKPEGLLGDALAQLMGRALAGKPPQRFMAELNGERWRGEEIAHALSRNNRLPDDLLADFEVPPLTLGHLGVVASAVMLALSMADGPEPPMTDPELTLIAASTYPNARTVALMARRPSELQPVETEDEPAQQAG